MPLYTSLVRPLLEYANVTWPVSFKKDIDKLERVQRRATSLLPHITQLHYQDRLKILTYRVLSTEGFEAT